MKVLTYKIILEEPLLLTSLDGDPNSGVSFDYIPGSVLRGFLISKYINENKTFNAIDPFIRRLFFDGTTRYLNGYLVHKDGYNSIATLPTPLSLHHEKDNKSEYFDFAVDLTEKEDCPEKQWKSKSNSFCILDEKIIINPDRVINVHTARTRRHGRAMPSDKISYDDNPGAVYRYEALQKDQIFQASIIFDNNEDSEIIKPLLNGEANLGGSRSAGYGRVKIENVVESSKWQKIDKEPDLEDWDHLIFTLLSDLILRDKNGQYAADPEAITSLIAKALAIDNLKLCPKRTHLYPTITAGFNRKWGLPLPQTIASKMGSVLVFDKPNIDETKLLEKIRLLEQKGIGERRAEGFGCVVFNWQTETQLTFKEFKETETQVDDIEILDAVSQTIAKQMVDRIVAGRLETALIKRANELGKALAKQIKQANILSNSQLSRLRLAIHNALLKEQDPGRKDLAEYLENLKSRPTIRKQFSQLKLSGKPFFDWLEKYFLTDCDIWEVLDNFSHREFPKIGNIKVHTNELAYKYQLRLVDLVLAYAIKARKGAN